MLKENDKRSKLHLHLVILIAGVIIAAFVLAFNRAAAADGLLEVAAVSPLHPVFPLLDENGENVLDSGNPASTMNTCGDCHDTAFIEQHSFHADVGLSVYGIDSDDYLREWDTSPGLFGEWDPITYRYLSLDGDSVPDLTTAEWIQELGERHVGGGPAVYGRDSELLTELSADASTLETSIVDPETGELIPWDWQESGVVEMNCFLCHAPDPNNEARVAMLQTGAFQWANTATLVGSGIVEQVGGELRWNPDAFDADGNLLEDAVFVQDPANENCAQCHGEVHTSNEPLTIDAYSLEQWETATTGEVISPQRISESGMNIAGKDELTRTWDVHTERLVNCVDCHYSLNNPVYYQEGSDSQPEHLEFDPRRIEIGEYLYQPLHQFAKGQSAQGALAPELDNSLRRCESCHSIESTHQWLPYQEAHTEALSCETCHIPEMYAPAMQSVDWTVLQVGTQPEASWRGVESAEGNPNPDLITGYEPILLPRQNSDGTTSLAPHNLVAAWFWAYGEEEALRPVPLRNLEAAWMDGDSYHPDVLAAFDADGNGTLSEAELVIDNEAKEALIASRLEAQGLASPHIVGEVQPYTISHDVASGEWATRDCRACHGEESRISQTVVLSDRIPGRVLPEFVSDDAVALTGELNISDTGALIYAPETDTESSTLYILGHDSVFWIDWLGIILFLGTLVGVVAHGGLRFFAARRRVKHEAKVEKVYMYGVYERLWHWLQTVVILGLIFTGLVIHKPDKFGIFSFDYVVQVHNVLAALLVANAALAAFYHLASGEIRQFLPQPRGFFNQAIVQARFYVDGIFKGKEHPFDKTPEKKLNPLQQITYFAILNVLLPLQIITGLLMWGAQRWPALADFLGGLPFFGPFHTLIAWLFATFVVMHVYLTTTGHTPLSSIKGMIMGWDEVEVHDTTEETGNDDTTDA